MTTTISRRKLISSAACLAGGMALSAGIYRYIDEGNYGSTLKLETVRISDPQVPEVFSGYKIGFITDIHLGVWIPPSVLIQALELIRATKVDLLVLGGDYICIPEIAAFEKMRVIRNEEAVGLKRRKAIPFLFDRCVDIISQYSFPDGTLALAGNHEHWNSTAAFKDAFNKSVRVKLLINKWHRLRRENAELAFIGVDDYLTGQPRIPPYEDEGPSTGRISSSTDKFITLLSHNPDFASYVLKRREPKLTINLAMCGHTHGGQVCLPGGAAIAYHISDQEFDRGLVQHDYSSVYTSRGLGVVGVPFRVNCPPEVTVFELHTV